MTMIQLVLLLLPTEFWKHCTLSWKSRKDIVLSHGTAWYQFSNLSIFLRRNEAIGITTGRAFCGVVGHMDRHEYTGRFLLSFSSSSSFSQPPLPHPPSPILLSITLLLPSSSPSPSFSHPPLPHPPSPILLSLFLLPHPPFLFFFFSSPFPFLLFFLLLVPHFPLKSSFLSLLYAIHLYPFSHWQ